MDRRIKTMLYAAAAVLLLAACRAGGGETTAPTEPLPQQTTVPATTLPKGEGVELWEEPVDTEPVQTTVPQSGATHTTQGPTEPQADSTEPQNDPTEPTRETTPAEPPAQTTAPTEPDSSGQQEEPPATSQPQTGGFDPASVTYEEYLAMSPAEQQAHYEMFPSLEDYIAWHNAALAEYEQNQGSIEATGGIDIGDYMNP